MKKNILNILFIFSALAFLPAETQPEQVKVGTGEQFALRQTITVKTDQLTTDNLGNFYLIRNDVLEKYDPKGTLLKTYSNKTFGKIDLVDANNPMKVLLFYRNFSQLVFLDNTLSLNGEPVSIEQLNIAQSPLISSSYNNGIWVYDPQNFELHRFDLNLARTHSSGNISQTIASAITPTLLTEYNNKVYLNDPAMGILIFDIYGTYSKTIPLKNISSFQVNGDNIVYIERKKIMSFNTLTLAQDSILLPDTGAIALRIEKDKLFLMNKEQIKIYQVK